MSNPAKVPEYFTIVERRKMASGKTIYEAWHPELVGVLGQGDTTALAEDDLREATLLALEYLAETAQTIPAPQLWQTRTPTGWHPLQQQPGAKREQPQINLVFA
jgi:predicted RNase H-like HicB family nuclease